MSYDYTACKSSLECLFDLGALGKMKLLSLVSHRQSSVASLMGGNWTSKVLTAIGIACDFFGVNTSVANGIVSPTN
ncbi:hypothetical protein TNCV_784801 [Trichonephila clavipes]|nr:hypothetical protein TNCV_784801 [Trichonephila clavipes]